MHKPVQTDLAPAAIGPYSQAIVADKLVFTSGQIPLDPQTGELVRGSIQEETTRVMDNLGAVLEAAGMQGQFTPLWGAMPMNNWLGIFRWPSGPR